MKAFCVSTEGGIFVVVIVYFFFSNVDFYEQSLM